MMLIKVFDHWINPALIWSLSENYSYSAGTKFESTTINGTGIYIKDKTPDEVAAEIKKQIGLTNPERG